MLLYKMISEIENLGHEKLIIFLWRKFNSEIIYENMYAENQLIGLSQRESGLFKEEIDFLLSLKSSNNN